MRSIVAKIVIWAPGTFALSLTAFAALSLTVSARLPGPTEGYIALVEPRFDPWGILPYYGAILLVIALLAYALAVHLLGPLRDLRRAVDRFGHGELSARVRSTAQGRDRRRAGPSTRWPSGSTPCCPSSGDCSRTSRTSSVLPWPGSPSPSSWPARVRTPSRA